MLQRFEVKGVHYTVDENLQKYVTKKIGRLDRYLAAHTKASAHTQVTLKENKVKGGKDCLCEVVMHLPHGDITVKESTVNMYAAVDIAEAKLKLQLKKYKDTHASPRLHRRLIRRFKRSS